MRALERDQPISAPTVAPIWRRFVASSIDVIAAVGGLVVASVVAASFTTHISWLRGLFDRWLARETQQPEQRRAVAGRLRKAQVGIRLVHEVQRRNHQSLGQKVMRVRHVDAADGGRVKVRRVVMRYAVSQLLWASAWRAVKLIVQRSRTEVEMRPEPEEVNHTADDSQRSEADGARRKLPMGSVSFTLIPSAVIPPALLVALQSACMIASPKRQTVSQFAAGIVTTTEPRKPS